MSDCNSSVGTVIRRSIANFIVSEDIFRDEFIFQVSTPQICEGEPEPDVESPSDPNDSSDDKVKPFTKKYPKAKRMRKYKTPTLNKSDSLLYFPNTLARLTNGGDMKAISHVVKTCFHHEAVVRMDGMPIDLTTYLSLLSITNVLYCDSLNCVQSTRVVGNQISSRVYFKYTDVAEMYAHAPVVVTNPLFRSVFVGKRADIMHSRLRIDTKHPTLQRQLLDLIESDDPLQIYGTSDLTITFDYYTQKIVRLQYINTMTSVGHDGERYYL